MSREPKKCLYVINNDYFAGVIDWDDFFDNGKIDKLIEDGNAFKVNPGYEWRTYCKLVSWYIPLLSCFIKEFDIKLMIYDSDGYNKLKKIYHNYVKNKKEEVIPMPMIKTNYKLDKETEITNELHSSGPWAEPEKVKAIRETIEAVMKNTGKTDLKDMDLDMLSSCINATFNREKMFYKWLNEFTNEEVDDKTINFAFKFLDWVLLNKIDLEKTNGICFKE